MVKKDLNGLPLKVIGFVIDITKRKQTELELKHKNDELRKINSEKDKFFSIIAHDLRGPLGVLIELTQMISAESVNLTENEKKELFTALGNSARNSFNLLENLLEWSRMQRGNIEFKPQIFNLKDLVNECVKVIGESARRKEIDLFADIPVGQEVFADYHMLQTIIRNLISNAIKFTRQGGKITISAKSDENNATLISVEDSGIGMSNDLIDNLFRIDVDTKRPGTNGEQSTGLGLQLCKEFIEKHGGKIWVGSEVGKGSVFSFTIPQHE